MIVRMLRGSLGDQTTLHRLTLAAYGGSDFLPARCGEIAGQRLWMPVPDPDAAKATDRLFHDCKPCHKES